MKIAMLTYSIKPRGGVVHALNLAEAISGQGHEVHLFALAKEKGAKFFRPVSVPYSIFDFIPDNGDHPTPESKAVANVERMIAKYVEKLPRGFDVYHTQDCVGAVALNRLKKQGLNAPTVRTIHHIDIFNEYRLQKFQEESINDCDVKLVVSKYWQDHLRKNHGISTEITYNGVHPERFENAGGGTIRKKYGVTGKSAVLFIGGLEPRKGLEYLIMAMEQVIKKHSDTVLLAVARGGLVERGERGWFKMLVERLRLENHVKIIDYIDERDVPKYYAACDVYAMPSRMEGWGIGIMEAMSAGKPVVATRAGGIPELVSSGKNGILVEPGNVSALASAISKLLASQALRNRLGAAGRKTVRRYSWEETARKTINVYEEAIASREKASRVGRGRGG